MSSIRSRRFLVPAFWLLGGAVVLTLALALTRTARASSTLDAANRAFAEGRYGAAATQLESRLAENGYSAPVLFDVGNTYLRADRPADAILAYERARLLAPRDAGIAANLAAARKVAGVPGESGLAYRFESLLSIDEWTWTVTGALWLTLAAGTASVLWSRRRRPLITAAGVLAVVALTAGTGLTLSSRILSAGLATRAAPVLVSPFASAQSSFSLLAGASVELGAVHDGYVLVHEPDGRSGWVERQAVARVVPD